MGHYNIYVLRTLFINNKGYYGYTANLQTALVHIIKN